MKNIKQRLRQGEALLGCWLNLGSPVTAEIVGMAGFDWVLIDLEHGAGSEGDVLPQLQALARTSAAAVVRVESHQRQRIHRVLDFGAEGVMCPRIQNAQEAQDAVAAMCYPPDGIRGVATMIRATDFGAHFGDYRAGMKDTLLGIMQIETLDVLNSLDEVAAIDGVDVLFIGPADLSMALGVFGQFDHPRFVEAIDATAKAAKKAGKAAGVLIKQPEQFQSYFDLGFRFIACGADSAFVVRGAANTLKALKDLQSAR